MKLPSTKMAAVLIMLLLVIAIIPVGIAMEWDGHTEAEIPAWELKWETAGINGIEEAAAWPAGEWSFIQASGARPLPPPGTASAWLRLSLPPAGANPAILIDKVYGDSLKAFIDNRLIYDSDGDVEYSGNKVLIPLPAQDSAKQLYLWNAGSKEFGIEGEVRVGSYNKLLSFYVKQDLVDLVLGAAMIFMAGALLVCLLFLKPEFFYSGFYLILVIISFGVLLITYSPFLPLIISGGERLRGICFDLALFTLMPAFTLYFEQLFGPGKRGLTTRVRNFQLTYSLFCAGALILNAVLSFRLDALYSFLTINVTGTLMIAQFMYLLYLALSYARRGNTDAIVFSGGFTVFAVVSLSELLHYFLSTERYHLYWWKWGMVVFVISLIVILGRRFAGSHEKAVEYSRELEKFNNDLQRSEKMEIISELAASVAHEVRNPLQVTRGFLQILGERSGNKEKEYLQMAVEELDRASVIITDFLTFAKPGMDTVDVFEVSGELKHVAGILVPLANLQGGSIELRLQKDLQVTGSPAKFKQAFINLIKNSIESLQEEGLIVVTAWRSGESIIVSVKDNGEGMRVSELARLGEPYYSNKTKGTGLGLMVTFRIIEAMDGSIEFNSRKGEGTEVMITLPAFADN
ncbi:sensor histidine kinase [Paenibacillus tritici]|uniref:sensor histidine kinase n=1 Tax=Paenibacillus tritici TaxID=1873425 RepID=UPI001BA6799D|nr:sensor histidine kinase [Paenibacillus tritici]QUL55858.1 sensor histidine kinase [Paenibacillus tritici]